jgi:1,4-alpha-glucan branching enzyme
MFDDAAAPDMLNWAEIDAICDGRHGNPFAVLGPHPITTGANSGKSVVRALAHFASAVRVLMNGREIPMERLGDSPLFEATIPSARSYRLAITWPDGNEQVIDDPYRFGPILSDFDLYLIAEGRHRELAMCLGAHAVKIDGVSGVRFAVWAPNAMRVSVVGDFNGWDGRRHPMRLRHAGGVWEIFIPGTVEGARYKYELLDRNGALLPQKADPMAMQTQAPPATASVVPSPINYAFTDAKWMEARKDTWWQRAPLTIYEVHVGSWLRSVNDPEHGWQILADKLIPYVTGLGFTHLELMPIMEYPFGGSWGYQPLAQFAPTARYGSPHDFAAFIDRCHGAGLGVILDWVPAHFPTDAHGLAHFDGTSLYEYADPREGFHRDWDTYIYNFGRNEVRGFLVASALYWVEYFHIDALRVDAVASMLYRDYSRNPGEWVPNKYGGRENLEAIEFIKDLNQSVVERAPGAMVIAEESTAWPLVSRPVSEGGLGFTFKWNMGWMHDTLHYMEHPPIHRSYHHNDMTFGMMYAYFEHFVLPLSHDEVVYGKKSLLAKMPGDWWQQFANLRTYYAFMWTYPGKKLMFMGCEIAQPTEWNHDAELSWDVLKDVSHLGVQRLIGDLNHLLRGEPSLYQCDDREAGFQWVVVDDRADSVFAYLRYSENATPLLVICNMTPVVRYGYHVGAPQGGRWKELLNTDSERYAGSNVGNSGAVEALEHGAHGQPYALSVTLPPLSTLIFKPEAYG